MKKKSKEKQRSALKELKTERDQLASLQKTVEPLSILGKKSFDQIFNDLSKTVQGAVEARAASLWRPSDDNKFIAITFSRGLSKEYVRYFAEHPLPIGGGEEAGVAGRVATTHKAMFEPDYWGVKVIQRLGSISLQMIRKEKIVSLAALPLLVEKKLFGVFVLYFPKTHLFAPGERSILEVAANTVAIAIGNILYRQKLEDARAHEEEERKKTELILANLADGLLVFDEEQKLRIINPAAEKMFKLSRKNVLGTAVKELGSFAALKPLTKIIHEGFARVAQKEIAFSPRNFIGVVAVPFEIGFKKYGTIVVIRDISKEKEIERVKSEFVSLAAHQLRTPLAGIKWTLQALLDGDFGALSGEQKTYVAKTSSANDRMIELVNNLLDVARIEEERYVSNPKRVSLGGITEAVVTLYAEEAKRKNINLHFERPTKKIPETIVDEEKIRFVIQNLLDNALRYTQAGGTITVTLTHTEKEISVAVRDTGIGIPADEQPRIFQKFFRASNAQRVDTEGSGLGLYLAKNIIEAHNGVLTITSQEEKGTTVSFTIPCAH